MGIVFVAGVHAVGKSTSCKHVANKYGIAHFSASSLIKAEKQNAISSDSKAVTDVDGNQELLLKAVDRKLSQTVSHVLLDGHFTLINAIGSIESIDIELFYKLPLAGIVVYHDKPNEISVRMGERDGHTIQPSDIAYHQNLEIEHAERVSTELGVSIKILNAFDTNGLEHSVSQWLLGDRPSV